MFYGLGVVYHPLTTPLLFSFGWWGEGLYVLNGGWDERRCVEKILRPLGGIYV